MPVDVVGDQEKINVQDLKVKAPEREERRSWFDPRVDLDESFFTKIQEVVDTHQDNKSEQENNWENYFKSLLALQYTKYNGKTIFELQDRQLESLGYWLVQANEDVSSDFFNCNWDNRYYLGAIANIVGAGFEQGMTWDVVSGKLKEIQKREEWIDWLDLAFAAKVLNPNEDPMRLLQLFELTQVKNFIRRRDLGYNRLSTSAFIPLARNYATLRFISEDLFQEFFEEAREAFAKNIEEQKNKNTLNDPEYIFY